MDASSMGPGGGAGIDNQEAVEVQGRGGVPPSVLSNTSARCFNRLVLYGLANLSTTRNGTAREGLDTMINGFEGNENGNI